MIFSDFTKKNYSPQDFLRLIEHRIRKEIRQQEGFSTKELYELSETKTIQSQVLIHFLNQIFHNRLNLSSGKIIETDYLEIYLSKKLNVFLENSQTNTLLTTPIIPLRSISEHEIKEVAKLLFLKGEFTTHPQELIDSLQKKYSQSKPSFLKSFSHIENIFKNNKFN